MNTWVKFKIFCLFFSLLTPSLSHAKVGKAFLHPSQLPPLETLESIVLSRAGLDPRQIKSWEKRSRWSAALPTFQVGWESKFINQNTTIIQDSISVNSSGVQIGPESNRLDADIENNQDLEVKAVWSLDELIFNRHQLDVSREARDLFFVRTRLLEELHQCYYELKSSLVGFQIEPSLIQDPLEALKVERLIDKLNSLTGGEFKRMLQEKRNITHLAKDTGGFYERKNTSSLD